MTGTSEADLQALRLTYNAALAAHQSCVRALAEATMAGAGTAAQLLESEARARRELEGARARLLAAVTHAITGGPAEPEPPPRNPRNRPPHEST